MQLVLLVTLGGSVAAGAQEGLNEARVVIPDASAQARIEAIPRALDQVFTKLSGHRVAEVSPEREVELVGAASLVQRYRYEAPSSEKPMMLWVRFHEGGLAESAQRAGVTLWTGPRPAPLLWAAVRSGDSADLVGLDSEGDLDQSLLDAAWRRGLPLRLPLLDLDDRGRVEPEDVRSKNTEVLALASERYPAGPVVGVSVERSSEAAWDASWLLMDSGELVSWSSQGVTSGQALAGGVDQLADLIVARYAAGSAGSAEEPVDPAESAEEPAEPTESAGAAADPAGSTEAAAEPDESVSTVEIAVRGVSSGGEYGRLMSYLREMDGVSRFAMLPSEGEFVRFRIDLPGGEDGFRRMISTQDVLEPDGGESEYRMK